MAGASGKLQGSVGSEDAGLSCLGTRSSSHSLSLVRRGDGTTRSSTGWQWKIASCRQPCTHGLGRSHCPAAAWLVSHCPPPQPSWGMDHCWETMVMDAPPVHGASEDIPDCSHGGSTQTLGPGRQGAEAMGAATKGLSPSPRCGEQDGLSWSRRRRFRGQPSTSDRRDLRTHAGSPGSQADRGKHPQPPLPVHPKPSESSPRGQRRDVFPRAVLLTLPQLPAPSPRGGQVFALLPGNGAGAKLAKI